MGRPCTICAHPEIQDIDEVLKTASSLRDIAVRFGVSKAALHRHWHTHVIEERPLESPTGGETSAAPSHHGFWFRVKTIAKWGGAIGVGAGVVWLAVTAPQPTPEAQETKPVPRVYRVLKPHL